MDACVIISRPKYGLIWRVFPSDKIYTAKEAKVVVDLYKQLYPQLRFRVIKIDTTKVPI